MNEASFIGVDLAKNVFQLHGAAADGTVVSRKKLSRVQFARFMGEALGCAPSRWRPALAPTTGRVSWHRRDIVCG